VFWRSVLMIRFCTGLVLTIASVAAIEGTVGFAVGIPLSILGGIVMLWGLSGMARRGQLL
jgi:hypothetical protein